MFVKLKKINGFYFNLHTPLSLHLLGNIDGCALIKTNMQKSLLKLFKAVRIPYF